MLSLQGNRVLLTHFWGANTFLRCSSFFFSLNISSGINALVSFSSTPSCICRDWEYSHSFPWWVQVAAFHMENSVTLGILHQEFFELYWRWYLYMVFGSPFVSLHMISNSYLFNHSFTVLSSFYCNLKSIQLNWMPAHISRLILWSRTTGH